MTIPCIPIECTLLMHGSFILVSCDQKFAFGVYFYPFLFVSPCWPLSKIFWLEHCTKIHIQLDWELIRPWVCIQVAISDLTRYLWHTKMKMTKSNFKLFTVGFYCLFLLTKEASKQYSEKGHYIFTRKVFQKSCHFSEN